MALSIGRYRIVERIAAGGMGEVYRAVAETEGGIGKDVALKLVRPDLAADADLAAMFTEEMRLALTLSHANVVQTFDVGRIDDRYFLAMELVDGTTLAGLLAACRDRLGQPLPWRHALTVAVEALKGLDYAHRRSGPDGRLLGLVHRDVSPSNVLVSREGEVKVADFGVATSASRSWRSLAGTIVGKVEYMAPEQLRGERVDRRADVWSMGVVVFEMLAGARPFRGAYPDVVPLVVEGRRRRLAEAVPGIPPALARVVERALEVERERRFPSAAAMRQELEEVAVAQGWLLSVTDLAELVQATQAADPEEASRRAAAGGWTDLTEGETVDELEPVGSPPRPPTGGSGRAADPFDVILGRELERLDVAEGLSVFRTAAGRPPLAVLPAVVSSLAGSAPAPLALSGSGPLDPAVATSGPQVPPAVHVGPAPAPAPRRLGAPVLIATGLLVAAVVASIALATRGERGSPADPGRVATVSARPLADGAVPAAPVAEPARQARRTPQIAEVREGAGALAAAASGTTDASVAPAPAVGSDDGPVASSPEARSPVDPAPPGRAGARTPAERRRGAEPGPAGRARETPAAVAPTPAADAWLSVNTDPWSNVYVDGRMVRATPLLRYRVAPGRHRVVVRNPSLGVERAMSVELAPGEHRRITFDLR